MGGKKDEWISSGEHYKSDNMTIWHVTCHRCVCRLQVHCFIYNNGIKFSMGVSL